MDTRTHDYVHGMKQGDREAFELCYQDISPTIYSAILRICMNRDIADDLLHDTFIKIFENIHSFDEQLSFIAWAKRIAFNLTFNFIKKASNRRHENIDESMLLSSISLVESSFSNENLIAVLFDDITERERLILWLFIVEQYTHDEISLIVERSASYSKSILSRALKKIKQHEEVIKDAI